MKKGWILFTIIIGSVAQAGNPVNLTNWTAESYPAVSGFSPGDWQLAPDFLSVTQVINGQPTIFHSALTAFGTSLFGEITVISGGDNDFVGFVLGFRPGDSSNPAADYLLIDWKQGTQFFNFGAPSNTTPGTTAPRGMAVSRVTGLPTADEFWGHVNFPENPAGGLEELARAATLSDTGWVSQQSYQFQLDFSPTRLVVFVDGTMEFDIPGNFANGRWGFYNFSQSGVSYSQLSFTTVDTDGDLINDQDDNCLLVANVDQRDTDGDDIGNLCDPDIAPVVNDCMVNFLDLDQMRAAFFSMPASPNWNVDADFNGDDVVNFLDLNIARQYFFSVPGPSGLETACN